MNTKLIKVVLSAVVVLTVAGCHSLPGRLPLSDGQKDVITMNKSPFAVVLTPEGHLLATDANGKILERCSVGPKASHDLKPCQGLQKDYAVQSLTTLTVIRSKKNPECMTFIDSVYGFAQEICW